MPGPSCDTTRPLPVPEIRFQSDVQSRFGPTLLQATQAGHTSSSVAASHSVGLITAAAAAGFAAVRMSTSCPWLDAGGHPATM
jgi:hypothetical protein